MALTLPLMFANPATAEFSMNLGFETEFMRDGISQSSGNPVVQAGAQYLSDTGLYTGVWASQVEIDDNSIHSEWDFYAGFSRYLTDDIGIDLGLTRYTFQGDYEIEPMAYSSRFARLLYKDALVAGYRLAPNYMGSPFALQSLELSYTFPLNTFGLELYAARHRYEEIDEDFHFGDERRDDYWHMRVQLDRSWGNYDYRLGFSHTNLSREFDGGSIFTFGVHRYFDF